MAVQSKIGVYPSLVGAAAARSPASQWAILTLVTVATFMSTLDTSIVNISLPTIAHAFGAPLSGAIE